MTITEKLLIDELSAARAATAELMQRLQLAYSALAVEQDRHEQTKAKLGWLRKQLKKQGVVINEEEKDR